MQIVLIIISSETEIHMQHSQQLFTVILVVLGTWCFCHTILLWLLCWNCLTLGTPSLFTWICWCVDCFHEDALEWQLCCSIGTVPAAFSHNSIQNMSNNSITILFRAQTSLYQDNVWFRPIFLIQTPRGIVLLPARHNAVVIAWFWVGCTVIVSKRNHSP